jgi:hypothetical protein
MILPTALVLGVQLMAPVIPVAAMPAARAPDRVPELNVEQVCQGIAEQGGVTFHDPAIAQEKKNCIDSEQVIRNELVKQWPNFDARDKASCVNESKMGGESSYTELLTCLEMARDVRAMRSDQLGPAPAGAASSAIQGPLGGAKPRQ